ncbi:MAG: hypothetical protein RL068_457 [Actinomycetota bacterium]|jgi:hypothetical protein
MIQLSRLALTAFTLAFGLYHGVLGLIYFAQYDQPGYALLAVTIYFIALALSIFDRPGLALRVEFAATNLIAALSIPLLMAAAVTPNHASGYATWHIAGISTLMSITAVRQHRLIAWSGLIAMLIEVWLWGGFGMLFNAGLIGAVLLLVAANAAATVISKSNRAADDYRRLALANAAETVARSAARVERQARVEQALRSALPLLQSIVSTRGELSDGQRRNALLTEGELRDQIRGRNFATEPLTSEVKAARGRGVEVQLLDDGGLEELDEDKQRLILKRLSEELSKVRSGKVVIRSVAHEDWTVTMAAIRRESDSPDLFLRL